MTWTPISSPQLVVKQTLILAKADAVTTSDGRTLRWKRHHSAEKAVDLIAAIGVHEYATAYAFCVLRNDSEGNGVISLGSDDGVAVWISGHRVHRNPNTTLSFRNS